LKRIFSLLFSVILLTACTPASPAPIATAIPPTETSIPTDISMPADTPTTTPTAEPTVTLTPEPTKIPMPDGWTAIVETKEIGGLQVVVNEKGEGFVLVNKNWYPADPNGCFHEGLLSDQVQKNPELYELRSRLSLKDVYLDNKKIKDGTYLYSVGRIANNWGDHYSSTKGAYIWEKTDGVFPSYWEDETDGIIWRQQLCYAETEKQWLHTLDIVLPMPVIIADETVFTRLAVGWLNDSLSYNTFTHYQEMNLEKIVNNSQQMLNKQLVYPAAVQKKPFGLKAAFDLWEKLVKEKKHVQIQCPFYFNLNKSHSLDNSYQRRLEQLISEVPRSDPYSWSEDALDLDFEEWAQKDDSPIRFFTNGENRTEWYTMEKGRSKQDDNIWTRYIQKVISGQFPILFIRTISIPTETAAPELSATEISTSMTQEIPAPATLPVCNPGSTVEGLADETIPGYMDILSVSTQLAGTKLTVTFHLREIPEEITLNRSSLPEGTSEIAWGVDIDKDNNPDTGNANFVLGTGYGFDSTFQAYNIKQGAERNGSIQDLMRYLTKVWDAKKEDLSIRSGTVGKIEVNPNEKTLTLSASIPKINKESVLHFYTFYNGDVQRIDELCKR
jgi:hypothetical protein